MNGRCDDEMLAQELFDNVLVEEVDQSRFPLEDLLMSKVKIV